MQEGKSIKYAIRDKKSGQFALLRSERNPKDRYACCEISHYIYFESYHQPTAGFWLVDNKETILDALTTDTKYYNADSPLHPTKEFDVDDLQLEIVEVEIDTKFKCIPIDEA